MICIQTLTETKADATWRTKDAAELGDRFLKDTH